MRTTILLAPLLGVLFSAFALPIKGQFINKVDVPGPVGPWSVKEKDTALYKGNWRLQYVEERLAKFTQSLRKGGDAIMSDTPKIVGGFQVNATSTLHPFQVALLSASSSSDWVGQFCGGTLYMGQYVITAAHCSDFVNNPTDVSVLVGTNTLSTTGKGYRVPVASIAIHPMWNPSTYDYDVAVWKLAVNVTNVTSIPMLSARDVDVAAGLQATVTGWGATENSPAGTPSWPTQLRAAVVPVVSRTVCNGAASYNGAITSRMLCAGKTGIDSCQGDSGGPLTLKKSSTAPSDILTGVVSWGIGCADANFPGVYARVSSPEIYDFIVAVVNDTRVLNGWLQAATYESFLPLRSEEMFSPACPPTKQVKSCSATSSVSSVIGTAFPAIDYKTETFAMKCVCTFHNQGTGATGSVLMQCAAYCEK